MRVADFKRYKELALEQAKKFFKKVSPTKFTCEPLIFCHFAKGIGEKTYGAVKSFNTEFAKAQGDEASSSTPALATPSFRGVSSLLEKASDLAPKSDLTEKLSALTPSFPGDEIKSDQEAQTLRKKVEELELLFAVHFLLVFMLLSKGTLQSPVAAPRPPI